MSAKTYIVRMIEGRDLGDKGLFEQGKTYRVEYSLYVKFIQRMGIGEVVSDEEAAKIDVIDSTVAEEVRTEGDAQQEQAEEKAAGAEGSAQENSDSDEGDAGTAAVPGGSAESPPSAGYSMRHTGGGYYHVYDADGNTITEKPVQKAEAQRIIHTRTSDTHL